MPRQLPWTSKAGSSRTQVKAPPRKKSRIVSDIDDGFFEGNVLASTKKGKERAVDSDDDLSDLAVEPKTPRTNHLRRAHRSADRAPSSSPPPIADVEPTIELMHKGVSKFDLRDDEWMMVEDEFLETAKLFTRHLHIAEYERLKKTIEAKKKQVGNEIPRPVVPGAKLSFESAMKEKAKMQEKKQREAIRDVFASENEDGDDLFTTRPSLTNVHSRMSSDSNSDGEDLDAIKLPPRRALPSKRVTAPIARPPIMGPQVTPSISRPTSTSISTSTATTTTNHSHMTTSTPSFKKPAPPQTLAKPRARPARTTPFDMLDDYIPKKAPVSSKAESTASTQVSPAPKTPAPVSFSGASTAGRTPMSTRTIESIETNDWGTRRPSASPGTSNHVTDRLAKRKAERKKNATEEQKRKAVKLDDIPTFLF
ncbi:hypothetical protein J1614_009440 [Plenodomus biglobosus]|nr:hypothetical protein J1614_009440 [Plenodomus biglobosus]